VPVVMGTKVLLLAGRAIGKIAKVSRRRIRESGKPLPIGKVSRRRNTHSPTILVGKEKERPWPTRRVGLWAKRML